MQHVFKLGELLFDKGLKPGKREAGLRFGKPVEQFAKNTLRVADVRQRILSTDGFFNHRHQVISNFCRGRQHGGHLPLFGITFQDIGNAQEPLRICH